MKAKKRKTLVFYGLGFPITLVNAPMRKVFGEWIIDVDMENLQLFVLRSLAYKPIPMTREELKFVRKFLNLTTTDFGRIFGVSHVAVVNWEKGNRHVSPAIELCIRLHILNHLHVRDKEFRNLYAEISLEKLHRKATGNIVPIKIDVSSDELKIAI